MTKYLQQIPEKSQRHCQHEEIYNAVESLLQLLMGN